MKDVDIIIANQSDPELFKKRLDEYEPLKENSKRSEDIWDIMEIYACRYPSGQQAIDEFRASLYCELSKVSDDQVPHSMHDKMKYAQTRWARYIIQNELSKL